MFKRWLERRRQARLKRAEERTLEFVRQMHPGAQISIVRDDEGSTILVREDIDRGNLAVKSYLERRFEVG